MISCTAVFATPRTSRFHGTIRRTVFVAVAACLMIAAEVIVPAVLHAQELEMINRPVNTSGLTGLLYTTSPFTLPQGVFEIGTGLVTERSDLPDYSVYNYVLTLSYGLNDTMEMAIKADYWKEKQEQLTKLPRPAVSLFAVGILPTGDRTAGTNSVAHWGSRAGLSLGSEILIEDYVMGVYGDLSATVQDLSDTELRDWYHTVNAGIQLPISKYRNLQMFVEYNRQKGKDVVTLHDDDYSAFTYGLRLVNVRFNFTFGAQFIHKYGNDNNRDTSKLIGILSIKLF
jgi:hypothetical protein